MGKVAFGAAVFFLLTIAGAVLRYLFFRYRITADSVLIREGVLKKTQLDIKFDRIQAINTRQSIIYRAFGLVTIMLDTAGSGKQEGHIPAVRMLLADSLKERIRQTAATKPAGDDAASNDDDADDRASPARRLLSLQSADMIRIGLSSNRALVFLIFLGPLLERLGDSVEESIEEGIENGAIAATEMAQASFSSSLSYGLMIFFGVILFLVTTSVIGAFLRYHRFELVNDNHVLRSTGGLLTRHEHSIGVTKVQSVLVSQNVVLRLFRRFRLQARQASSDRTKASKSFTIPLCRPDQLHTLSREFFGDEYRDAVLDPGSSNFTPIASQYFRTRVLWFGIVPAMLLTTTMAFLVGLSSLLFLLWIPLNAYISWRLFKGYGFFIATDGVALRRGLIGFRVSTFLHRKIQRISLTQTVMQRRKGLATLRFFLASGSVKLPYMDYREACQLRDYALYRAESNRAAWH